LQLILFLSALWLFSLFVSPLQGAAPSVLCIVDRIICAAGYVCNAEKRCPGTIITFTAATALLIGGLIRVVLPLFAAGQ